MLNEKLLLNSKKDKYYSLWLTLDYGTYKDASDDTIYIYSGTEMAWDDNVIGYITADEYTSSDLFTKEILIPKTGYYWIVGTTKAGIESKKIMSGAVTDYHTAGHNCRFYFDTSLNEGYLTVTIWND